MLVIYGFHPAQVIHLLENGGIIKEYSLAFSE